MQLWRIEQKKYKDSAFEGIGGLFVQSRWIPKGYRAVYTSESLALASLEKFVHLESFNLDLVAIRISISPETSIETVEFNSLPSNWQKESAYPQLQQIGKEWLLSQRTPILKVPSAIIPVEFNYILNPEHSDFNITPDLEMDFLFDRRMWKTSID